MSHAAEDRVHEGIAELAVGVSRLHHVHGPLAYCRRLRDEGEADGLRLSGEVDAVEHLGESSLIHMHLDDGTIVIARTPGDSPTIPGTRVTMSAPVSALQVFAESGMALGRG